ncbi:MAG: hypothetical protein Q9M20_07365 [Mariprofundaceae bacterium]|nr:hypothetical protein [Mariprofundaceae bacterium]
MAIYQPGTRSNLILLVSSFFTIIFLMALIIGNLVVAIYLWFHFTQQADLEAISALTGIAEKHLMISVGVALAMDVWIFIHGRKGHEKRKFR